VTALFVFTTQLSSRAFRVARRASHQGRSAKETRSIVGREEVAWATIAETRLEIAAQRKDLEATADGLHDALDIGKRIRENPGVVIGIGATAAFLVAGGPKRMARLLRRRLAPNAAEQAYDALPAPMQAWVSTLADEAGPKAAKVRDELVEELRRWRRDPIKDKKARRELARQMVDGPPGPARTVWTGRDVLRPRWRGSRGRPSSFDR
jgi:hypothetical protein